jgi:hypothetical protein
MQIELGFSNYSSISNFRKKEDDTKQTKLEIPTVAKIIMKY